MPWNLLDFSGSSLRGRNWVKRLKRKRWDLRREYQRCDPTPPYSHLTCFRMKETGWRWQSDRGRRGCESCNLNWRRWSSRPSQSRSVVISLTSHGSNIYLKEYLNLPLDHKREQNKLARLLPAPLYICYSQVCVKPCDSFLQSIWHTSSLRLWFSAKALAKFWRLIGFSK